MKLDNWEDQVIFRPMNERDVPQVYQIERVSFPYPWFPNLFIRETKKPGFSFFQVMELNGKIIGYAGYWKIRNEAHLVDLAVHPDWRRRGLGSRLFRYITDQIKSKGMDLVTLEVRETNLVAQRFYEKFDFQKIAVRQAYYKDTGENAIICWKKLGKIQDKPQYLPEFKA